MDDSGTWIPAGCVEGQYSLYAPKDRLTAAQFQQAAECYDPKHRRAKVLCGYDPKTGVAGPAHKMGRFLPPVGDIEAVKFDGKHFHVQIRQHQNHEGKPAVKELVKRGFNDVSICLMPKSDLPGSPLYLDHVAILAGELPGTPGIPPLSEAFRAFEAAGFGDFLPFLPADSPELGLDGFKASSLYRSLAESEASHIAPPDPPEKEQDMTAEELTAAVTRALADALPGAVKAAVQAELAPVTESIATVRTLAEEAKTSAQALAVTAAMSGLEGRLRSCVESGRLRPAELDDDLLTLRALPAEKQGEFVERREKRAPMRSLTRELPYTPFEDAPADLRDYADPQGKVRVRPEDADLNSRVINSDAYKADPTPETYARVALAMDQRGEAN